MKRPVTYLATAVVLLLSCTASAQYATPYPAPTYGYPTYPAAPPPPPAPLPPPDTASDGTGLVVGGVITLGSFYLASALSGAALNEACDAGTPDELDDMNIELSICGDANVDTAFIPVVGPFIAAAELEGEELSVWPLNVALFGVGIGQVTGIGLLIASAFVGGDDDPPPPVTVTPIVGPRAAAMSLRASF